MKPLLCNCEEQKTDKLYEYEVPLRGGRYTTFVAGRCVHCGKWIVFPSFNFELALSEGTEEAHKFLESCGILGEEPVREGLWKKLVDWIKTARRRW